MPPSKRPPNPAFDPFGRLKGKQQAPSRHQCQHPGCSRPGEHRAPRDRSLQEYLWLCVDHVREHNRQWNFCQGMSEEELERELRKDACWQRPTWKLGSLGVGGAGRSAEWSQRVRDDLGIFAADLKAAEAARRARAREQSRRKAAAANTAEARAVTVLDIEVPFTRDQLRSRWLTLVKQNHPDLNPGDAAAEERLKAINEAYKTLLKCLNTVSSGGSP